LSIINDNELNNSLRTKNLVLQYDLLTSCIEIIAKKGIIHLDKYTHEKFSKANPKLHMAYVTFRKGLNELVKSQILAKSKRMGDYFINPHFLFNGDRMRFITEIKRKNHIVIK